ncbi:hypothetical protein D3C77_803300 [compost metagenome]
MQNRLADGVVRRLAAGFCAEQFLAIGMLRSAEQFLTRRLFDDASALHDTYAVGDSAHQVEVVADDQQ